MTISAGVELEDDANTKGYVLKIHRNTYGQKKEGQVWNKYLVNKLVKKLGFKQSKVNNCVFCTGIQNTICLAYIPTTAYLLDQPDKRKEIKKIQ
jgi:hypothetical protein